MELDLADLAGGGNKKLPKMKQKKKDGKELRRNVSMILGSKIKKLLS